ncbi:MAG: 16S rRNA (cytosine(1402)-N(4))-methyltransferase RsmH [Ignavibacteriae bacterium]|nr:16S rRNA (cytosine(1402)-N(4))-methyltransferase RsmH [Ignavibacteriota bacterium]
MDTDFHIPVLLNKAVELLINPEIKEHILIDGTTGGGGYSKRVCETCDSLKLLVCIDKDLNALGHSEKNLSIYSDRIKFVNENFANIKKVADDLGIMKISGIILDLGLSNYQLTDEDGFSYLRNTPLDMRADKKKNLKAAEVLNSYDKSGLIGIFKEYGEIGNEERLTNAIINTRKKKKLNTTFDLNLVIETEYKIKSIALNKFLSKIYQAVRIEVNGELDDLKKVLENSFELIEDKGRLVVVSYHSLEDRIVKNFIKEKAFTPSVSKYGREEINRTRKLKILTKKAVLPERFEVNSNPKSRSAKLRAAEVNG